MTTLNTAHAIEAFWADCVERLAALALSS